MTEIRSQVAKIHKMKQLSKTERDEVWLMSVLPEVVNVVAHKEAYERMWLEYDKDGDGELKTDELTRIAVDAVNQAPKLIKVLYQSGCLYHHR